MKKRSLVISLVAGLFVLTAAAYSDAPGIAKMCQGCHSADGISSKENVPSIAGISAGVHIDYLYAYKDGARVCTDAKTKAMCTMTAKLTDEQIEQLADYYSALPYRPVKQEFDAGKAAAGAAIHEAQCSKCHSDGGSNPEDDASILAGQPLAYLKQSLTQFASEQREQPQSMQRKMTALSAEDLEALAHYYASQQ